MARPICLVFLKSAARAGSRIGDVEAGGKTIRELEKNVVMKQRNGYLRKLRVSIEVTNYRPFDILGEEKRPSSYAYVEGMKIVNAVAMSGGFT